ncbi:hypothetical protein CUR178_02011 [Leishmania enriettii]|uniref:Uncharacterized protein n=1 Tax=Leishmania enriettii TaxID=5663 RepID=A0A836H3R4_LEIEN|nr:hypothetical protein CUR178_02011 [Leishmania enriettii]
MSDVISPAPLSPGGVDEGVGPLSYAAISSWFRRRLLPTLFPSPATAAMPSLQLVPLSPDSQANIEATAAAKASLSSAPQRVAEAPTRSAFLSAKRGPALKVPAPVSPLTHATSLESAEGTTEAAAGASSMQALLLPPVLPLRSGGFASSTTTGVATDSFVFPGSSPTPGPASLVNTTPRLGPSSSLFDVSAASTETSNAVLNTSASVSFTRNGRRGLLSSTSSTFLHPASQSSSFAVPAGSFAAALTPPTCVELPGPQSLFVRGSDALGCGGRSPRLLQADSRTGMSGTPPMKV